MRLVLDLTRKQAESLHDLLVDADMHGGRVVYPTPLAAGLHDAVAEPILAALLEDPQDPFADPATLIDEPINLTPAEEAAWSAAARMIVEKRIPQAAIADAVRAAESMGLLA